jgi:tRNA-dihydrouridine synthase C
VPVVANGEIWSVADALRCRDVSGSDSLMLGRGMVSDPGLALAIRAELACSGAGARHEVGWPVLLALVADFWRIVCARLERRQQAGRLKQWLNFLRRRHPQAQVAYEAVRTLTEAAQVERWLAAQGALASVK